MKTRTERVIYTVLFFAILAPMLLWASQSFDVPLFFNVRGAGTVAKIDADGYLFSTGVKGYNGTLAIGASTDTVTMPGTGVNSGTVTNNNTVTFASEVRVNTANQTGKLSWLTTGNTAVIAGLTLSDANYIVILEPTTQVTDAAVTSRAATGFTITKTSHPTSDVSQRYLLIQSTRYN